MQNPYHPLSLEHKLSDFVVYKEFIKYMKKTKVIIPALGLLLLSTAASVSGTVAWFAMNASVTANGMQITAKSDSSFLIIGTSDNLTTVQTGNATSVDLTAVNAEVFPVAHDTISNTATATTTEVSNLKQYKLNSNESTKISIDEYNALPSAATEGDANDQTDYTAENADGTNWYYQVADTAGNYESHKQKNYLATLDEDYIIHQTVYVTMAVGSQNASNLRIKSASLTVNNSKTGAAETFEAVTVLVTSASEKVEFKNGTIASVNPSTTVLASSVTSAALIPIDIFVYYDGNHSSVYTNNIANLEGAIVNLTFDVNRA